ncbi:MAG TPA: TetR/AcrR family transcriptional regulator [Desulfomicrobiaceae bacterium]|jgi:AcrR family transcriptional regulator|nr:TetR/AcrR family transcriptional regulator [Desulfomicrobiaceae bacterium]HCF05871.1 TetR/AcrR family transcriptional regulator [Desulfomicrobiaceae bacterium]
MCAKIASSRKESLLAAAKVLFGMHGYAETTFKKIAQEAGVALGLLTHYFGTKERLFLAAGLDVLHDLIRTEEAALAQAQTGLEAVRIFAETYFAFATDPDRHFLILIRCSPFSDLKGMAEREVMERDFHKLYLLLEEALAKGVADGSIRPVDPLRTSRVIFCNLVGGVRHHLLTPYATATLLNDLVDFVINGIAAPTP